MNETPQSWYDFRNAVQAGDFALADQMLRREPGLLHLTNRLGETVLHFLAVENDAEGVAWLYARGADLDTKNTFGDPVIFEVAPLEYRDSFDWFVSKDADIKATNASDQDLVLYLLEMDREDMAAWVRSRGA